MPSCNRREFLIRAGLVRPPIITDAQKERFIAECMSWGSETPSPVRKPGFARSIWVLIGWAGAGTVAWVLLAGMAMAWLSW